MKSIKTVLINPPSLVNYEKWDRPRYPSITLGYLASSLEEAGIACDIIDARLEAMSVTGVIERLSKIQFDIVGITAMTHNIQMAGELASAIKKKFISCRVVIGGVHASALPVETLKSFPQFDFLIAGEGEETFPELIAAVRNKMSLKDINGLVFRENSGITANAPRALIQNLDKIPYPAWEKFPPSLEYHIMTARGCPYNCIFCMSPYGRKVRERSAENTLEEIKKVIQNYNPSVLRFNDETFAFNISRANAILDGIIEHNLVKTPKHASMRADRVEASILTKMKKAGFVYVDYGVESGNADILKAIKKNVTLEQTERAIGLTKQAGLKVGVNVIIGHPHETMETANQTINYAVKLNADITAIGIMVPYPGTQVAEMAAKGEGGYKLLSTDWKDYNKQMGNAMELENLSRKNLEQLQTFGYLKIYAYNHRWKELAGFIWTYRMAGLRFLRRQFHL